MKTTSIPKFRHKMPLIAFCKSARSYLSLKLKLQTVKKNGRKNHINKRKY